MSSINESSDSKTYENPDGTLIKISVPELDQNIKLGCFFKTTDTTEFFPRFKNRVS